MNVRPYGPFVLVVPDPPEKQYKGLIYMPDGNVDERLGYGSGVVLAVGPGHFNRKRGAKSKYSPLDVCVGQRVVYRGHLKYANPVPGTDSCLVHAQDIIGELIEGQLNVSRPYNN